MLIRYVTLWPWPLTRDLKVRGTSSVPLSKSVRSSSEIEQSSAKLLTILRIFGHVMSRCDLNFWPLDLELLQHFECHVFKLCTKFRIWAKSITLRLSYWRFSMISPCNFMAWALLPNVSQGCVHQTHQTWRKHKAIIAPHCTFQSSDTLLHFQTRAALKFEWCWKRRQISYFLTLCEN